jgi:hypothetical protein
VVGPGAFGRFLLFFPKPDARGSSAPLTGSFWSIRKAGTDAAERDRREEMGLRDPPLSSGRLGYLA